MTRAIRPLASRDQVLGLAVGLRFLVRSRSLCVLVALASIGVFWLVAVPPASAVTVVRTVPANLDGDGHIERVQLMKGTRPNPYGGTMPLAVRFVRVLDRVKGQRVTERVSPRLEHIPRHRGFAVRDLAGDGRREVFYRGFNGGAGAVPVYSGVRRWTGRRPLTLWAYRAHGLIGWHNGRRYYYAGASVRVVDDITGNSATEILLTEGARRASEPNCCPSFIRWSWYRYSTLRRQYVRYDRYWEHT
jgi:hypothetical protein